MIEITSTPSFIIDALQRRGIEADLEHTGGGCTAVKINVELTATQTAFILITDVSGTTCDLGEAERKSFLGWVAGYYASEDELLYGEDAYWIHAAAYERECEVLSAHTGGGVTAGRQAVERLAVDWKTDALDMVNAIVSYVDNLRVSRV